MNNVKKNLYFMICCIFLCFLSCLVLERQHQENLSATIAPEIIRFRILANSNNLKDQKLKLKLRNYILTELQQSYPVECSITDLHSMLLSQKKNIAKKAEDFLYRNGCDLPVSVSAGPSWFPQKKYGDLVFPEGSYNALKIVIGNGKGRNWWCVLYPPLCFVDETCAIVPDSSKELLKNKIGDENYQLMLDGNSHLHIRFWIVDQFKELLSDL